MRLLTKVAMMSLVSMVYAVGCSEVGFESVPGAKCDEFNRNYGTDSCKLDADGFEKYDFTVKYGKVDLLFINDNSGSMYVEQEKLAQYFSKLHEAIEDFDVQVAITTTDIIKEKGRFLSFPDGSSYLTSKHIQNGTFLSYFQQVIKRAETKACEDSDFVTCPSSDERGVYAANLAVMAADKGFFRADAHLAVVILSDEDERSSGGLFADYPLEALDLPKTLVSNVAKYLGKAKTFSVHPIIIRPDDPICLAKQNSQPKVKGYVGTIYAQLGNPSEELMASGNLIRGQLGDICEDRPEQYAAQMRRIGEGMRYYPIRLPCNPVDGSLNVSFDPVPTSQIEFDVDEKLLLDLSPLPSAGTDIRIQLKCVRM